MGRKNDFHREGGWGTRIFRRRKGEKGRKNGSAEQGIESARPLDLVHALIVRRNGEIICKPPSALGSRSSRSENADLGHPVFSYLPLWDLRHPPLEEGD